MSEIIELILNEFTDDNQLISYVGVLWDDMELGIKEFENIGIKQGWFTDIKDHVVGIIDCKNKDGDIIKNVYVNQIGLKNCVNFYNWPLA